MTEVYHVGNLSVDRLSDPELDRAARDYLERGTRLGVPVYPRMGEDSPRGRGEGILTQRKLWPGIYEYGFIPIVGLDRRQPS